MNNFMVSPYIQIKNTSDRRKLHTFLKVHIHVSDYKISGKTSADPVVDHTCILKQ